MGNCDNKDKGTSNLLGFLFIVYRIIIQISMFSFFHIINSSFRILVVFKEGVGTGSRAAPNKFRGIFSPIVKNFLLPCYLK